MNSDCIFIQQKNIKKIRALGFETIFNAFFLHDSQFFTSLKDDLGIGVKPKFSWFSGNNNYILFDGETSFWLIQRANFAFALFFPEHNVVIHRAAHNEKLVSAIRYIKKIEPKIKKTDNPSIYLINGYSRPYHYFYQSTQGFYYYDTSFVSGLIDLRELAFLPSSIFKKNIEQYTLSTNEINEFLSTNNSIGFIVSSLPEINIFNFIEMSSLHISHNIGHYNYNKNFTNKKIIWIGLCQESRCWLEQKETIISLVKKINKTHNNICFVFDGLTCPHYLDSKLFIKEKCSKEQALLLSIINDTQLPKDNFISLIGAKAYEKIQIATDISFFISDGLTDSIWPAAFGKKPGVVYAIERTRDVHFHPSSTFIPKDEVKEIGDGLGNWARVDFSINPNYFIDFVMLHLKKHL